MDRVIQSPGKYVVGPAKLQPPHPHWLSAGFDLYPSPK